MNRVRGFVPIELLLVLALLGLLAQVGLPFATSLRRDARFATAIVDLQTLRGALASEYAATGALPAPEPLVAEVPQALRPYLPRGFSFRRDGYTIYWYGSLSVGARPGRANITIVCDDAELLAAIDHTMAPNAAGRTVIGRIAVYDLMQPAL